MDDEKKNGSLDDIGRASSPRNAEAITRRRTFEELPFRLKDDPKASAWGLWGPGDELGTLNYLTADIISQAAKEVLTGTVVPLNSTHWDGLRHYPYQDETNPKYYNGALQADISGSTANYRIGIQNVAQRGIVGRGVLLDWRSYALRNKIQYSPFTSHPIPLDELLAVAAEQNVTFRRGDVLLIRSGWTEEYLKLTTEQQLALSRREKREFVGVEASREMIKWHWDNEFAAVAGDTNAYEVWPPTKPWGVACHEVFLSGWGMPIGELWDLEELAQRCRQANRWTFFLTSMPLNLKGGVASPANVMAIF